MASVYEIARQRNTEGIDLVACAALQREIALRQKRNDEKKPERKAQHKKWAHTEAGKKEDVDKVIAEKDNELRHNKYRRCLAMAKWCRMHDEFTQLESERLGIQQRTLFFEYRKKAMWWNKWCKRWLELAEKFKEAYESHRFCTRSFEGMEPQAGAD